MNKREFLKGGLGLGLGASLPAGALAGPDRKQPRARPAVPNRTARTTRLYRCPEGAPNALAGAPEGLWVGEQKAPGSADPSEKAMLLDWRTGALLRTVVTQSRNTSGMAYGGGCIWMGANAPPQGFFQTDMDSRTLSHRQIPLGPAQDGGGTHGALWHEDKLWIVANRLRGILRVDPVSWTPEYMIPFNHVRWHDIAWDNGTIWMVTGTSSHIPSNVGGLARYDVATGRLLETVTFEAGSADPHGLELHEGVLYTCDAGIGPGFVDTDSPTARYICRIDIL